MCVLVYIQRIHFAIDRCNALLFCVHARMCTLVFGDVKWATLSYNNRKRMYGM